MHSYPVGPDDPRNGHVTSGCSTFPRDLAPKDRNGASDPFVRVRYSGRTQETSVRGLGRGQAGSGSGLGPHHPGGQAGTTVPQKRLGKAG